LTTDNSCDLEISYSGDPVLVASFILGPTCRPNCGKEWSDIAYREQYISFEAKTSTWNDSISEIPSNRGQRIFFHHLPDRSQFLLGFLMIYSSIESKLLSKWKIGPVDTLWSVSIIGVDKLLQNIGLVLSWRRALEMNVVITSLRAVRSTDDAHVRGVMMLMVSEIGLVHLDVLGEFARKCQGKGWQWRGTKLSVWLGIAHRDTK
jgi:hypothetical protein